MEGSNEIENKNSEETATETEFFSEQVVVESTQSEEENPEEDFLSVLQETLERLRSLSGNAAELKLPVPTTDIQSVYKKLCKALHVPETSTFSSGIDSESMDFSYHCLGLFGIIPVTKALTLHFKIKKLDFAYNKLGSESLPAIALLLDQNHNITHLNLSCNGIGKNCANELRSLIDNCSLEFLDLSNNNIGDEGLSAIAQELMKVDNIKELNLSRNDFSADRSAAFGSCIAKCVTLEKLDLSCNHFEDGAIGLFIVLKNSNLKFLDISRNGIPDEAMPVLAAGLRGNKSLQELSLSSNYITNKGAVLLAPGIRGSSTLEILRLSYNPFQGAAASAVLNSAGNNLKILDLSGIKGNIDFLKTLRSYEKCGKNLEVLFGTEIRFSLFPKDYFLPRQDTLTESNALMYMQQLADEKGVSLRITLKIIHATFIAEQHAAVSELLEKSELDQDKEPRQMTIEAFANGLTNSQLAVPRSLALELARYLAEDGYINMWKIISETKWRPDALIIKLKQEKKEAPPQKPKGKK
ncbi:leucine-rich repeat-containing protein 74A-like [Stegodyphus dumicola]|uniref:leucine-rich repeat-containing protein 74A-like n=1 Tax=Stegodyphus dumicola TaxID=202533 RepID=UPI0015AF071B|nr:leucine-rich repeat-containing protein 74A-like [Stegodyphus dumicola]